MEGHAAIDFFQMFFKALADGQLAENVIFICLLYIEWLSYTDQ